MSKIKIGLFLVLCLMLMNIPLIISQQNNHSNIDPYLLDKFNKNKKWMNAYIILGNMSAEDQINFVNEHLSDGFKVKKSFYRKVSTSEKITAKINNSVFADLMEDDNIKVIYYKKKFLKEFDEREIMNEVENENNYGQSRYLPLIEKEVYLALENSERVNVIIIIKDQGDDHIIDQIISSLNEEEFKLKYESSSGRWVSGDITRKGLEKLKDNQNIIRIYVPILGSGDYVDVTALPTIENSIYDKFETNEWVRVIVKTRLANPDYRDYLDGSEFKWTGTLSDGFGGYITKQGLEKLSKNPYVMAVHLSHDLGIGISDTSSPYISPDVLNELEKSEFVDVIIVFEGVSENNYQSFIQSITSKNVIFIERLLRGDSISVKINKEGLQELGGYSNIKKILYNRVIDITSENNNLLRICPEQYIINHSPCLGNCNLITRNYFILNGIRREVSEFDENWISINCNFETLIVE